MELRAAREASDKTQAQVAKEIGVSEIAYQRYEYDKRIPNAHTAQRIAQALGSTVEDLFPLPRAIIVGIEKQQEVR